jgi:5'-methylthioadenosine phosphorylase
MSDHPKTILGIIGGSGLYDIKDIERIKEHAIDTPFGAPSDLILEAKVDQQTVFFLPRHGRGHRLLPSEVNYAANIYAFKLLGVTSVLAVSAVGIMRDGIKPGDMIIPDQIYDRTKGIRRSTFFGDGAVGHVTFAEPFCSRFRAAVTQAAKSQTKNIHEGGAYICMEGPQFSTKAESNHYRQTLNPTIIGMTAIPEAKLAREAEMCYAMLALGTDYDCWKDSGETVSVEAVVAILKANATLANKIICQTVKSTPESLGCDCHKAAEYAILTSPEFIPLTTKQRLETLYGKYFS